MIAMRTQFFQRSIYKADDQIPAAFEPLEARIGREEVGVRNGQREELVCREELERRVSDGGVACGPKVTAGTARLNDNVVNAMADYFVIEARRQQRNIRALNSHAMASSDHWVAGHWTVTARNDEEMPSAGNLIVTTAARRKTSQWRATRLKDRRKTMWFLLVVAAGAVVRGEAVPGRIWARYPRGTGYQAHRAARPSPWGSPGKALPASGTASRKCVPPALSLSAFTSLSSFETESFETESFETEHKTTYTAILSSECQKRRFEKSCLVMFGAG